jgi:hypothetical protein
MAPDPSSGTPQFATAEYSARSAAIACGSCGQAIGGTWYRVNGVPACPDCTRRMQEAVPQDSHQAFARGLLFGIGAAVLGCIIYVVVALTTGLVIGFVSLAVGYLVGKAIGLGSRGVGGRRYQVAAVALTYMAVSLAAVPIAMSVHHRQQVAQQHAPAGVPGATAAATPAAQPSATPAHAPKMGFAQAIGVLTLLGLASPFLELRDPMHGAIGLIILMVGIRFAWRLTAAKPLDISGPIATPAPAASG